MKEQFIQVTLKPASDDKGLIKGIGYVFDDNSGQVVAAGDVKCINDPTLVKVERERGRGRIFFLFIDSSNV